MQLEVLSDYELGRLVTSIEWVARGGKPLASCGSRRLSQEQVEQLRRDLEQGISLSGETAISAYILSRSSDPNFFEYGVFLYPWALDARIYIEEHESPEWLQGFVYGYSVTAIQDFRGALRELTSKSQPSDICHTVEIVRLCSARSHTHSS